MNNKIMIGGNILGYFINEQDSKKIFKRARDQNIYAIDTADVYGKGMSEEIIGKNLCKDRKKWFVATKVGLHSEESPEHLGSKKSIIHKIHHSLKRLKTDYVDLYQIHHFDPVTDLSETIEAFDQLKKEGKIIQAGISNYNEKNLKELSKHTNHGFSFHQLLYNLSVQNKQQMLLSQSLKMGMNIIAYAVMCRGLLNEKYLQDVVPPQSRAAISNNVRQDLTADFLAKLRLTQDLVKKHNYTITQVALNWIKTVEGVAYTIIGFRDFVQFNEIINNFKIEIPSEISNALNKIWN